MKKLLTETEKQYIFQNRLKLTIKEISNYLQKSSNTIRYFLASHKLPYKRAVVSRNPNLTEREKEVMELVSKGLNNQQITDKLVISLSTLKTHLGNIYSKYNLTGTEQDFSVQRVRAVLKFKEKMFQEKITQHCSLCEEWAKKYQTLEKEYKSFKCQQVFPNQCHCAFRCLSNDYCQDAEDKISELKTKI